MSPTGCAVALEKLGLELSTLAVNGLTLPPRGKIERVGGKT